MSTRSIVCPGSGTVAVAAPMGNNPKITCPRCQKRVGVMHTGKVRKHKYLGKVK